MSYDFSMKYIYGLWFSGLQCFFKSQPHVSYSETALWWFFLKISSFPCPNAFISGEALSYFP